MSLNLEKESEFLQRKDAIWVLLTIAEAYNYKNNSDLMKAFEDKAQKMAEENNDDFAMSSYVEQKRKIEEIFLKLK